MWCRVDANGGTHGSFRSEVRDFGARVWAVVYSHEGGRFHGCADVAGSGGVEGLPEGNVAPGLDAEDAVGTGPVPTETAGASSAVSKSFQIDFNQFFQLIPRDAIFPFYDPEFVSADAANLDDGELVIGVEINGEARAYPVGPLNRREMVNHRVGDVPILVTW